LTADCQQSTHYPWIWAVFRSCRPYVHVMGMQTVLSIMNMVICIFVLNLN